MSADSEVLGWYCNGDSINSQGPIHTHEQCKHSVESDNRIPVTQADKDRYHLRECTTCRHLNTEELDL